MFLSLRVCDGCASLNSKVFLERFTQNTRVQSRMLTTVSMVAKREKANQWQDSNPSQKAEHQL